MTDIVPRMTDGRHTPRPSLKHSEITTKHESGESMTAPRCTGRKTNGEPCKGWRVSGATVCKRHLPNPQARANAAVRAEALRWQPGTPHEDPGEILLRLVTQGWARATRLAGELERLVDQHGGDLTAALVGDTMMPHPGGGEVKVGEYIRGL